MSPLLAGAGAAALDSSPVRRSSVLAPLAIACVAAIYLALFVSYGVNLEDEGLLLLQIARTARGQVPYLDFHTGYTPGAFYLNAALVRLLGESVLPMRWLLVAVNAAVIGLLFALARPWAGNAIAAATALGYAAFLPCFIGEFASFNIPYPSWYSAAAFLAAQWAMDRYLVVGRGRLLVLAGAFCGLAFGFKPNAGVLAILASGLTLAMLRAGDGDPDRRSARVLLVLAALVIATMFAGYVVEVELPAIGGPVILVILGRLLLARARDGGAPVLWPSIARIAAGAAALALPWAAPFLVVLGPARFLRDVLLVGSEADLIYALTFPLPTGFPASWPAVAALGLVFAGLAGLAAEQSHLRVSRAVSLVAIGAGTVVSLVVSWARMPEGVARSIYWQAQHVGFYLIPLMAVAVGGVLLLRLRGQAARFGVRERRLLNALTFATCMYVMLWPRVDTMHLVGAMPSALVLGAACAARFARAWAGVLRLPEAVARAGVAAAAAALALLAAVPNLAGPFARPQVALDSPRVPISVEAERGNDLRALDAMLAYLRARLAPAEPLFAFPALALVPYALGHPTPTPHDYFFPGRPDHRVEVEVVRALEAARPRYVVTLNRRLGFFSASPDYYFILRAYVRQGWVLAARFGRYDVLVRADVLHGPPIVESFTDRPAPEAMLAEFADPDRERRQAAVDVFMGRAATPAGIASLGSAIAPDERTQLLLLRNLSEAGDARATPFLVETTRTAGARVRREASAALTILTIRDDGVGRSLGPPADPPPPRLADHLDGLPLAEVRTWMANRDLRREVGVFAGRALGLAGDRDAIPVLERVLAEETRRPILQVTAAKALVELGERQRLCDLVELLDEQKQDVQNFVPSYLIEASATYPAETLHCLRQGLSSPSQRVREMCAWIAGAAGLGALAPQLSALVADPHEGPRIAAIWALGTLADPGSRAQIAALVSDPDAQVRAFAAEALQRIGAQHG